MLTCIFSEKRKLMQWINSFFLFSFCYFTSACSINPNPEKAGLVDSFYHLTNNTYQQQKVEKEKVLDHLMQQQTSYKKQLVVLNNRLQQEQQESTNAKKKLQVIKQQQKKTQKQLSTHNTVHIANKTQYTSLRQQSIKLDNDIKWLSDKAYKQNKTIQLLRKKRDALQKELFMQMSL